MTRLSWLLALPLLVACGPSAPAPSSPVANLAGSAPASSGSAASVRRAAPYTGPAGTCQLDGLAMPLYTTEDPHWGDPLAPVAIVIFSDFECPFCARQKLVLDDIKAHYGPTRLQLVWKNMPLMRHRRARPAAEAGQAVLEVGGADAFWKFHDLVFANNHEITPENLSLWAREAGVDASAYEQARARPSVAAHVNGDLALARLLGVNGTPMMIVNGIALEGLQDPNELTTLIDQLLAAAPTPAGFYACDRMRESWAPAAAK